MMIMVTALMWRIQKPKNPLRKKIKKRKNPLSVKKGDLPEFNICHNYRSDRRQLKLIIIELVHYRK